MRTVGHFFTVWLGRGLTLLGFLRVQFCISHRVALILVQSRAERSSKSKCVQSTFLKYTFPSGGLSINVSFLDSSWRRNTFTSSAVFLRGEKMFAFKPRLPKIFLLINHRIRSLKKSFGCMLCLKITDDHTPRYELKFCSILLCGWDEEARGRQGGWWYWGQADANIHCIPDRMTNDV